MDFKSLPGTPEGSLLVAASELAARQWELAAAAGPGGTAARAWVTPELVTFRRWLHMLHALAPDARPVLSGAQREALWRRVAASRAERLGLVNTRGPALWAAQADALLADWRIDADALAAGAADSDFAIFLDWRRDYRAALAASGWLDETDLLRAVDTLPLGPHGRVEWLDRLEWTPAERALRARVEGAGRQVHERPAPARRGAAYRIRLDDPAAELSAAARWAAARLATRDARVALVVPDLARREREIRLTLEDELRGGTRRGAAPRIWIQGGRALEDEPVVGAAAQGIELLTPRGAFAQLSFWLRSPFFHGRDPAARAAPARAEAELRASVLCQLRVVEARLEAGLVARLDELAAGVGTRLGRALEHAGPVGVARTPTQWLGVWQRGLRELGWPAADAAPEPRVWRAWEAALAELAELTPMLGRIDGTQALVELRAILARRRVECPLPAAGVHVLGRLDAVGPGYDAVWVTGLTDRAWPEAARLNPLLPRRLQVAHGMPGATPRSAWQRSAAATAALVERVDEAVFSWPEHLDEQVAEPSSLLSAMTETDCDALGIGAGMPPPSRVEPRALERPDDPAPALAETHVRGGARTLDLQSRAPLLAFCASRLHARPLERVARGLPPRAFGIAVHAALQALARALPAQAEWCAVRRAEVVRAVEQALARSFDGCRRPLAALFELERDRISGVLECLLEREAERSAFTIAAVEERQRIGVLGRTITCRIDRVDRLADGRLAVLDYKTGRAAPDWLGERLGDTQVPLYTLEQGAPVAAAAIVALGRDNVSFAGFWNAADMFPARAQRLLDAAEWRAQLDRWRAQIETLVAEYAAGDVRLFDAALDAEGRDYAPLSRICEHAARGKGPDV